MKWLAIAIIILAQQPAKTPEGQGAAETNRAKSTAPAKSIQGNQGQSTQPTPTPSQATVGTESQRNAATTGTHTQTSSQSTPDEDRSTQRKLTWFTGVLASVGVLQLVVMFLTWLVYRRQAREMRRQRHEMRRQRHVMYRQWKAIREQVGEMTAQRGVMGRQLTAMQNQGSEMKGQTDVLRTSVAVAKESADAAKASADALVNAERPWLFISPIGFRLDVISNRLDWRISNRGRTVANVLEVKLRCRKCRGMEKLLTVPPQYSVNINFYGVPVPPDGTLEAWSPAERDESKEALTERDREDIRSRGDDLVAYAYIRYSDQFGGRTHESRFCYYFAVPFQEFRINLQAPAEYHECT